MTISKSLTVTAMAVLMMLAGCAAQRHHSEGLDMVANGKVPDGLEQLRQANELEPGNARYRVDYLTQRQIAVQRLLQAADVAYGQGQLDTAAERLTDSLKIDPNNDRALRALQQIELRRHSEEQLQEAERQAQAGHWEQAQDLVRKVLRDMPNHPGAQSMQRGFNDRMDAERQAKEDRLGASKSVLRKPVTLQFRDAAVRQVFEAISRSTGINIVLDRDIRTDLRTTIFVKDASVEDAIDLILLQNQLEKRTLNANSLMIYPATPAKQKDYAELRVRTFQLSNVDAAHMANVLKSMLKIKDIVTDARTNTLVMRETADVIAVAEQLVAANDVADPEVMLEVEVLEVSSTRSRALGLQWPNAVSISTPGVSSSATSTTGSTSTAGSALTIGGMRAVTGNDLLVTPLSLGLNLKLVDSDANILASPRIRTRHKEKARIMVGDRVPVITNLISPGSGTGGTSNVMTGSIQYLDVGLKLEVEPQVYADNDVGIKVNLEVSTIAGTITTASGSAYQIGTRTAQTALRLHDGETQVLAGLINDEDRNAANKVPGLGQLPIIGALFRSDTDDSKKSEIVLSITPHVIRPLASAGQRTNDIYTGSESAVRSRPLRVDAMEVLKLGDGKAGAAALTPPPSTVPAGVMTPAAPAAAAVPPTVMPQPPQNTPPRPVHPGKLSVGETAPATSTGTGGIAPISSGMPGLPTVMPIRLPGRTLMPAPGTPYTPGAYGGAGSAPTPPAPEPAADPTPAPEPPAAEPATPTPSGTKP
ncbi:secretin N-terminal domain-containing protein [Leptothrix ochracea]|uniref:secretin N-terminal domain-containing protein n=1 Tax=Leptothrix ochracea TaxID=735331 RepID=UPI0034E2174F